MAFLINENLIWIAMPKCATYSIERALMASNLKVKKYNELFTKTTHIHTSLNTCFEYFGSNESVCITRDWFEKWLSSINFIWDIIEETSLEPVHRWEDLNNEHIYKIFNTDFVNYLNLGNKDGYDECFTRFVKNKKEEILETHDIQRIIGIPCTLLSQKYWKDNQQCTYEFDIKEMDKFIDFIEDRFGERLIIERINESTKKPNKLIINDELKSFVWERFEKTYEKRNQLI
jgi:hypothetical protein